MLNPVRMDPPAEVLNQRPRTNWKHVFKLLLHQPGEWFLVAEDVSSSTPARVRDLYGLETRVEKGDAPEGRVARMYARYVGKASPRDIREEVISAHALQGLDEEEQADYEVKLEAARAEIKRRRAEKAKQEQSTQNGETK